jgi:3',5'-cyclic AMP phosphodiesterase CpdA
MPRTAPATVRISHIADFHLPLPHSVRPWQLLNKRILGFLNLRLGRSRTHKLEPFRALLAQLAAEEADHTLIAGDVANLAFDFEYAAIDEMLRSAGLDPESTSVIPGNHDRYTALADLDDAFESGMAAWLPPGFARRPDGYPYAQELGPVTLIALDTAVWRGPIRAAGRIDGAQLERLVHQVELAESAGRWPVIAMHHPPFRLTDEPTTHYRTGLAGYESFVSALEGHRATVLHGHLHRFCRRRIGELDVIAPPSASNDRRVDDKQLAYCVYTFASNGMTDAELVRCWPAATDDSHRFERIPLPDPS